MREGIRNSRMMLNEVYFWTDTIKDWNHLLASDKFKNIILQSWKFLVEKKKIKIYGFAIMPNHLHVIWELLEMNGKENPHASFNKFTGHEFRKEIKLLEEGKLEAYKVKEFDREFRFWQRDPLAILMDSLYKMEQKLNYTHMNPLQERWNLVERPEDYKWSSARFYHDGVDDFGFLTHYKDRF